MLDIMTYYVYIRPRRSYLGLGLSTQIHEEDPWISCANSSRRCLTGNGENGVIIPEKCKKVLAIVIFLLYIIVLIEMSFLTI